MIELLVIRPGWWMTDGVFHPEEPEAASCESGWRKLTGSPLDPWWTGWSSRLKEPAGFCSHHQRSPSASSLPHCSSSCSDSHLLNRNRDVNNFFHLHQFLIMCEVLPSSLLHSGVYHPAASNELLNNLKELQLPGCERAVVDLLLNWAFRNRTKRFSYSR